MSATNGDNDVLGDSQSSGDELSDFEIRKWNYSSNKDDDIILSSSSSESDVSNTAIDISARRARSSLDPILSSVEESSKATRALRATSVPVPLKKNDGDLSITTFNLGASFDSKVADKVQQLKNAHQLIEEGLSHTQDSNPQTDIVTPEETVREMKKRYRSKLEQNKMLDNVDHDLINIMCRDETGRYRDWFFITKNSKDDNIPTGNILVFLTSIGVDPIMLEDDFHLVDVDVNELDPYPMIHHPDYILQEFNKTPIHDNSFKWWLLLILDKTIYNSLGCNLSWCQEMVEKFAKQHGSMKKLVELYWQYIRLNERKYYMLYRLTRIVPTLKPIFIKDMFQNDLKQLVKQFDMLFDAQNYKDLLYFILFIYGSELYPIGNSSNLEGDDDGAVSEAMNLYSDIDTILKDKPVKPNESQSISQYFKDCIIDVSSDGQSAREIPIILSILKLISFQT